MILAMTEPNAASRRQYGTVLVYGSIVESTGGTVVQNVDIVASNKAPYKKLKLPSQHRKNSRSVKINAPRVSDVLTSY